MWLLSPSIMGSSYANIFYLANNGALGHGVTYSSSGAVAPVINLKPEYVQKLIGIGVQNDEYRLPDVN